MIGRGTWGAIWAFSDIPEDEPTFLAQRKMVRKGQFSGEVAKAQILIDDILAGSRAPAPFRATEDIGDFTPRFDALVRLFQARTRQGIDGVVGRRTWSMLFLLSTMGTERERDEIPVGAG